MTHSERLALEYIATGDAAGSREAFAEIYAQLRTKTALADRALRVHFKKYFPEMIEAVRALNLP